jgi:hypothetical protein
MKEVFNKSDLSIVPRWTDNIKNEWINPFITESCAVNFRDSISFTLYDAIANLVNPIVSGAQGLVWDSDDTYTSGSIVLFDSRYYVAQTNILAAQPNPSLNSDWAQNSLINFWQDYMKPYLVYECYKSFILWHGKHVAQGGFRKHIDNTSSEINEGELSYLIGDLKNKVSLKNYAMMNFLNSVEYTFNNVKYEVNGNAKQGTKQQISIFAV